MLAYAWALQILMQNFEENCRGQTAVVYKLCKGTLGLSAYYYVLFFMQYFPNFDSHDSNFQVLKP